MDRPEDDAKEAGLEIPETVASEPPLRMFVSGRMDTPRDFALRARAVDAIRGTSILLDWAFEFTPPSTTDPVAVYENAASNADLLLYLGTDAISDAVRREVRIARDAGKPIVAIDASTSKAELGVAAFFKEIRNDVKYKKLTDDERLQSELTLAIGDLAKRFIREGRPFSRRFFLDQLYRESLLRIALGFEAAGLDPHLAESVSADRDLGARFDLQCPEPLAVVEGNVGAGKTLFGERWYGRALARAVNDRKAPLPYRLKASELQPGRLSEQITDATRGIGRWRDDGVALFIDGLDEPGVSDVQEVLKEARFVARLSSRNRVVISSRPSYGFASRERIVLSPLSDADALEVIRLASSHETSTLAFAHLERSVQDTVRSPLFALIYGSLLASDATPTVVDRVSLLDALVEKGLGRAEADRVAASAAIRSLATSMLNSGAARLQGHSISRPIRSDVLRSRLVREDDDGNLVFSLPALVDWFGSEALRDGDAPLDEILSSEAKAYSWRYPFAVAVTKAPADHADFLLSELFQKRPATAARVVIEAFTQYGKTGVGELPPSEDAQRRIEKAYDVVQAALGPLRVFSKREIGGQPFAIRAYTTGRSIEVEYFPPGVMPTDERNAPAFHAVSRVDTRSGWAYRYVLEEARGQLRRAIAERALWLDAGPEFEEWRWALAGQYAGEDGLVDLSTVRDVLRHLSPARQLFNRTGTVGVLLDVVERLISSGGQTLAGPYSIRPLSLDGHLNDTHRNEIARRCTRIYQNALQIYGELVETWLPPLIGRALNFSRLQPVHVDVILSEGFQNPDMIWARKRITPVGLNQLSSVVVRCGSWAPNLEEDRQLWEASRTQRPDPPPVQPDIAYLVVRPFADRPATTIAYDWLRNDLKELNWLD